MLRRILRLYLKMLKRKTKSSTRKEKPKVKLKRPKRQRRSRSPVSSQTLIHRGKQQDPRRYKDFSETKAPARISFCRTKSFPKPSGKATLMIQLWSPSRKPPSRRRRYVNLKTDPKSLSIRIQLRTKTSRRTRA